MYQKNYYEYMNEIKKEELLEGLVSEGLFTHQLPNIFQSQDFYKYIHSIKLCDVMGSPKSSRCITFQTMRNIGISRTMHIPNPFIYYKQCLEIAKNWDKLQEYFFQKTNKFEYKISQQHIKKVKGTKKLINTSNYNLHQLNKDKEYNIYRNKDYEHKLKLNAKYYVVSDISRFYDSIYTHSIPWALIGKKKAKKNHSKGKEYYNIIDEVTRNLKGGETSGIPIGPHSSNLISEIILVAIDKALYEKGWKFTRYIDDYICYVEKKEKCDKFIIDLKEELEIYNLNINESKTIKGKLPKTSHNWRSKINNFPPIFYKKQIKKRNEYINRINKQTKKMNKTEYDKLTYTDIRDYIDLLNNLAKDHNNYAIINYGIKVISDFEFSKNAKELYIYEIINLAKIYTYLIPLLEEHIFDKFHDYFLKRHEGIDLMHITINKIFEQNIYTRNYEAVTYAIYYALKYNVKITEIEFTEIKRTNNCIIYLLAYLYHKKNKNKDELKKYKKLAIDLADIKDNKINTSSESFQENWLFIYEVLDREYLKDGWSNIKKRGISFLRQEYLYK